MVREREGRWICPSCGRENLGRFETCEEGCGATRPNGVKFYLPGNSPVLTDSNLLAGARSGQDWYCSHCGGTNPNAHQGHKVISCVHCGEQRTKSNPSHNTKTVISSQTSRTHIALKALERLTEPRWEKRKRKGQQSGFSSFISLFAVIALIVITVAGLTASFALPTGQIDAKVEAFAWQRSITIEARQAMREEGWALPPQARKISSDTRIRDVIEVPNGTEMTGEICGQKDFGNGYFEDTPCIETVYKKIEETGTWYTYDIDRWNTVRTVPANGSERTPYWPEILTAENERINTRSEAYLVRLRLPDETNQIHSVGQATWLVLEKGQSVTIHTNWWGRSVGIEFLDTKPAIKDQMHVD